MQINVDQLGRTFLRLNEQERKDLHQMLSLLGEQNGGEYMVYLPVGQFSHFPKATINMHGGSVDDGER